MKNVYYIHLCDLYPSSSADLDVTRWLCRDCARKRHARPNLSFAVNGSEVCEDCGGKQISFPIGSFIERKRQQGAHTVAGRIVGAQNGKLVIDWIEPNRFGGDGWRRDRIGFTAVKPVNPDRRAAAERYAATLEARS